MAANQDVLGEMLDEMVTLVLDYGINEYLNITQSDMDITLN